MKVYCDTNVFMDYCDDRSDPVRPLKDFAFEFFAKGWNCSFKLIISDWLLYELHKHLNEEQIESVIDDFRDKKKLIMIKEEKGDRDKAKKISSHWQDPLHAILAHKAGADYLATRDREGFNGCEKLVQVVFPEFV